MLNKLFTVFIASIILIFSTIYQSYAFYTPDWDVEKAYNNAKKGSTVEMFARQRNNRNVVSSIVKSPTTKKLAKGFARGLGHGALVYSVAQLIGEGVDFVLDTENNRVKFDSDKVSCNKLISNTNKTYFGSVISACVEEVGDEGWWGTTTTKKISDTNYACSGSDYPDKEIAFMSCIGETEDFLTFEQIAREVQKQADLGHAESQEYILDIAIEEATEGLYDNDFEQNAKEDTAPAPDPDLETNPEPDPETNTCPAGYLLNTETNKCVPETQPQSFELPSFCTWASTLCDYTDWVKEQYTDAKKEYQEVKDWVMDEPVLDEPPDIEIQDKPDFDYQENATTQYLNIEKECPLPKEIPIQFMGSSSVIMLSYDPFCSFASMIKPAVILGAWISGLLIISGGRAKEG